MALAFDLRSLTLDNEFQPSKSKNRIDITTRRKSQVVEELKENSSVKVEKRFMGEFTELERIDSGDSKASMIDKLLYLINSRGKLI